MDYETYEKIRRSHEHHRFRKPHIVWNTGIPDKREGHTEDAQESEWFRAASTLCYRPPSTILVEDVVCDDRTHVQNKPRPQTRRYDKDSEADRWPGKMSGGLSREARDSGVVRRLELGTEGFWEFLYSDRWEDTCLLRVLHGALLDQLLTALYLLQRDHDVISYVTIACYENQYQRLPCMRPTTAPQPDLPQDAEQVLVELDYFCSQPRPPPFSDDPDQPLSFRDEADTESQAPHEPALSGDDASLMHGEAGLGICVPLSPLDDSRHPADDPLVARAGDVKEGYADSAAEGRVIRPSRGSSVSYELPVVSHRPRVQFASVLAQNPASSLWFASEAVSKTKCNIRGKKKPPPHMHCYDPYHMVREPFMVRREKEGGLFPPMALPTIGPLGLAKSRESSNTQFEASMTSLGKRSAKGVSSKRNREMSEDDHKIENTVDGADTILNYQPEAEQFITPEYSVRSLGSARTSTKSLVKSSASWPSKSLTSYPGCFSFQPVVKSSKSSVSSAVVSASSLTLGFVRSVSSQRSGVSRSVPLCRKSKSRNIVKESRRNGRHKQEMLPGDDDDHIASDEEGPKNKWYADPRRIRQLDADLDLMAHDLNVQPPPARKDPIKIKLAAELRNRRAELRLLHRQSANAAVGLQCEKKSLSGTEAAVPPVCCFDRKCTPIKWWKTSPTFDEFYYYLRDEDRKSWKRKVQEMTKAKPTRSDVNVSESVTRQGSRTKMIERRGNQSPQTKKVEFQTSLSFTGKSEEYDTSLFQAQTSSTQKKKLVGFEALSSTSQTTESHTKVSSRQESRSREHKTIPGISFSLPQETRAQTLTSTDSNSAGRLSDVKAASIGSLTDEQDEVTVKGGLMFSNYDLWHITVSSAYPPGGVCDSIGVRNALLQRRERIYRIIEDGKILRRLQEARLRSMLRKVPKFRCSIPPLLPTRSPSLMKPENDALRAAQELLTDTGDGETSEGDGRCRKGRDVRRPRVERKSNVSDKYKSTPCFKEHRKWDIESLRTVSDAHLPDDLDEETLFQVMGFQDVFDSRKLKNSYSFEKMFANQQDRMTNYKKLLREFKKPFSSDKPSELDSEMARLKAERKAGKIVTWSKNIPGISSSGQESCQSRDKKKRTCRSPVASSRRKLRTTGDRKKIPSPVERKPSAEEREKDQSPPEVAPPALPPVVLGKLRDFRFLKYRDYMPTPIRVDAPRNAMTIEEMCDRLLQAMQVFVVRKERATTTRQFQSKVSVTFTRRHVTGCAEEFMADARRVVAGTCRTLRESDAGQDPGLVPS